jgi:hypothetical protein
MFSLYKRESTKPRSSPTGPDYRKSQVLALVYSNLQKLYITGYNKAKYSYILVDDASSFTIIKRNILKDMAPNAVLDRMPAMEKLTRKRIKAIKTGHGREY